MRVPTMLARALTRVPFIAREGHGREGPGWDIAGQPGGLAGSDDGGLANEHVIPTPILCGPCDRIVLAVEDSGCHEGVVVTTNGVESVRDRPVRQSDSIIRKSLLQAKPDSRVSEGADSLTVYLETA